MKKSHFLGTNIDRIWPREVLPYQEVGGLGPGIEFRGKIWGKVQSSSPNKRKNLGSSVTTRRKNWERITILGAFGVISEIQRAKFGVTVTYIFGGKIWGSDMNFRDKIWGQAPRPPHMEVPPLGDLAALATFWDRHSTTSVQTTYSPLEF